MLNSLIVSVSDVPAGCGAYPGSGGQCQRPRQRLRVRQHRPLSRHHSQTRGLQNQVGFHHR